jgi:hypothetical protein
MRSLAAIVMRVGSATTVGAEGAGVYGTGEPGKPGADGDDPAGAEAGGRLEPDGAVEPQPAAATAVTVAIANITRPAPGRARPNRIRTVKPATARDPRPAS